MTSTFSLDMTLVYEQEQFKDFQRESFVTVNEQLRRRVAQLLRDIADDVDAGVNNKTCHNGSTWDFRDRSPMQTFCNALQISNQEPCPEQK